MKKRNRMKSLYWLIPIIVAVLWMAVGAKAGIVRNATSSQNGQDSLSVPLFVLDTAGNRVEFDTTADWGYIVTRYPNGVKAISDSFTIRGTNTPKIVKNAAEFGGFAQFCYRKQISDLDGTPVNGTYSFEVTVRDSSLKLWTLVKIGEFQLYQSKTFADANDSVTVDGSHFNGLSNAISATTLASNAITDAKVADDVKVDVNSISTDATAANNAESFFDGTGYAGTNNVIPLVTTTTTATNVTTVNGLASGVLTATAVADGAIDAGAIADNAIDSATFASSAKTGLAFYVWDSATRTLTSAGSGGMTLEEFDSATATWAGPDSIAIIVWNYATRSLTILDEDNTTIDLNASTIGTVTTVTNMVTANVTQISGDGTAADNLETMLDGTGGQTLTLEGLHITATSGPGMTITGASGQFGAQIVGGTNGSGLQVSSGASTGYGLVVSGNDGDIVAELTTGNFGTGAITENDIANGALRFGQEIDTVGNEEGVNVEGAGGSGASAADVWAYGTRTLTSGSVAANLYPYTQVITTVDAAGTTATRQFVVDSTSLGGANENGLVNKGITIKSDGAGLYFASGVIERVNCTGANCTLQVADALPYSVTSGDSIWIWGAEPAYVFATLAEASAEMSDSVVTKDTTGLGGDPTVGGLIVSGGAAGADTSAFKTMLANNEYARAKDSTLEMSETATGAGAIRRGEVPSTRAVAETTMTVIDRDSVIVRGGRVTYADTTLFADTLGSQVASSGGSSSGNGAYACTLYVRDAGTAIPGITIQVNNSTETARLGYHDADPNGRWIFNLDSGYVNVRVHYPNATQVINPQSVHVTSAGANDTIQITLLEGLKTLFLVALQDNQGPLSGAYVQFELLNIPNGEIAIDTTLGAALTRTKFITNANSAGVVSQELLRNCNIKFARSGEFNKTEWLVKAARLGRSLENPDLEFKFKISSNDSTYYRPSGD